MLKQIFVSLTLVLSLFSAHAVTEYPEGSVSFSKQELEQLTNQVNSLLQQAYSAGIVAGQEEIKNNTKLCPKDI